MNIARSLWIIVVSLLWFWPSFANAESSPPEVSRAIIILDASGSMWGEIEGTAKMDIARSVIADLVRNWDPKIELGLMAYGHRRKADCDDIELLIPPGPVDPSAFMQAVNNLTPKGKTPITASVIQAAETLRYTEERATVILVSDGVETCEMDPCAAAKQLAAQGVDFKAHVIGFDLTKEDQGAIECLATATGGLFLPASDATSLANALAVVVKTTAETPAPVATPTPTPAATPTPTPVATPTPAEGPAQLKLKVLLAEGGEAVEGFAVIREAQKDIQGHRKEVRSSSTATLFKLEPGRYHVTVKWGLATAEREIEMTPGASVEEIFVIDAGILRLTTFATAGGEAVEAYYTVRAGKTDLSGQRATLASTGSREFRLSAGNYLIEAKWGLAIKEVPVEIQANEALDLDIVLDAGIINILPVAAEGGEKVEAYNRVSEAKKNLSGQRRVLASSGRTDFRLSAGEYIITSTWGAAVGEVLATVKPGEAIEVPVILNAGVLQLETKEADGGVVDGIYYTILRAKKSLEGGRETVASSGATQFRLPAGSYIVQAKKGNRKGEVEVEIQAGGRTDAAVMLAE